MSLLGYDISYWFPKESERKESKKRAENEMIFWIVKQEWK